MSHDVASMGTAMIDAARAQVAKRWPELRVLAEMELPRLAQALTDLAGKVATGEIRETHARQLAHMHQVSARNILQTIDGIGLLTAERAIDAGVRAAAKAINAVATLL
jgi:hypothetical protein